MLTRRFPNFLKNRSIDLFKEISASFVCVYGYRQRGQAPLPYGFKWLQQL